MKRVIVFLLLTAMSVPLLAQFKGDGYYRIQNNSERKRYLSIANNKIDAANKSSLESGKAGNVFALKMIDNPVSDPSTVIYIIKEKDGYTLEAQGMNTLKLTGGLTLKVYSDKNGKGGIYNFVTKRGLCKGDNSKISWTQVETGSAVTWKYPGCILLGDNSVGEFNSVAVTNNYQQADTGTKMIHIGKNTRSTIVSKGISAGFSQNSYRGLVQVAKGAENARNYSQCDSLLLGDKCGAHTFPCIKNDNETAVVEHEATTSKISEEQLFYCRQRGISPENAVSLIVNGYAKDVLKKLPMEFAVEAQKLLSISLESSIG